MPIGPKYFDDIRENIITAQKSLLTSLIESIDTRLKIKHDDLAQKKYDELLDKDLDLSRFEFGLSVGPVAFEKIKNDLREAYLLAGWNVVEFPPTPSGVIVILLAKKPQTQK